LEVVNRHYTKSDDDDVNNDNNDDVSWSKLTQIETLHRISPLIGHAAEKLKYFYDTNRTQAIDCA